MDEENDVGGSLSKKRRLENEDFVHRDPEEPNTQVIFVSYFNFIRDNGAEKNFILKCDSLHLFFVGKHNPNRHIIRRYEK